MKWRTFVVIVFVVTACTSGQVPKGVLAPDDMKKVVFDIIRADEFAVNYIANDTSKRLLNERAKLYEKVFKLHKIDKKTFYKSYEYYQQNPDQNKILFDSLLAYGKRVRDLPAVQAPKNIKTN